MTQDEVLALMSSSTNEQEWNANCDTVKAAHDGGYPPYWFAEVIRSGLCDRVLGTGASDIKMTPLP